MQAIDIQALVKSAESGRAQERDQLFAALYNELHRLAQRELRSNAAVTLTPTALLHETFLSVAQQDGLVFVDKPRFMAYAARAMRGLLIDYLRSRQAKKRGGEFEITSLPTELPLVVEEDAEMQKLSDALDSLSKIDARLAECVDLKFFCGLSYADIAQLWQVSERTVQRDWDKARILLGRFLNDQVIQ